jgi:hypothetical protein
VIEQDEAFYLARVPDFDVDTSAHTADEQLTFLQFRWWSPESCGRPTIGLAARARRAPAPHRRADRWPVALGTQEESTVLDVH